MKTLFAIIMVIAIISTLFFGFWLLADGEFMFVMGFVISAALLILSVNGFIAYEFSAAANAKGYPEAKYFWYSFLFGIVGYLLVIALPDKRNA